jgi:LPXTG-motif cell wall-anchored protein
MLPEELARIEEYLAQGGRMLVLLPSGSNPRETGLEQVLAKWGVGIGNQAIVDPQNSRWGSDVIISAFTKHPVTNPLLTSWLFLVQPRPVGKLPSQSADAPKVDEIAFTSANAYLTGENARKRMLPVMAAVEKGPVKGVITPRGSTRIIVTGDSTFLANRQLDLGGNRDFAGFAVNWLLDRTQLIEGVGPRPVTEYRLVMTRSQMQAAQWLLLAGMPGVSLALGGLVWLRRRK